MDVLGVLLDRSLVRIGEAAEDARRFDRETIRTVADVWDNNTYPLFRAATAGTRGARERRAGAALRWMAGFGAERRAWMRAQAAVAGCSVDVWLASATPCVVEGDHRGRVTAAIVAGLVADYDLAASEVRGLEVERVGGRLVASLDLAVTRACRVGDDSRPGIVTLDLRLRDVTEVRFDSGDALGVVLRAKAGGVSVGIGECGLLRAAAAEVRVDDRHRDPSPAAEGRAVRFDEAPRQGRLGVRARVAADLLRRALVEMRLVASAEYASRVPIWDFHRAFAGAGAAVVDAGAHRLPYRREAAFRRLVGTWIRRGGPALAEWFATTLRDTGHRAAVSPSPVPESRPWSTPTRADLRLARYTPARASREASALVHLAVPPDPETAEHAPWRLLAVQRTDPAGFRLRAEAFHGTGTVGTDAAGSFALHGGALAVSARGECGRTAS